MSTVALDAFANSPSSLAPPGPSESVRAQALRLLTGLYPQTAAVERRRDQRYPYPQLITLHPVGPDGRTPVDEPLVVSGKHLSESGLGFFHPYPIAYRRVIASLQTPSGQWLGFLLDLGWCRFTRHGWYESGGRFLSCLPSPLAPNTELAT
ncbi:MAG: hypothetical protein K1X74_03620 [Pirellulales bacterium]|nr:hypothetical protein [Pirellulales bacterium]